MVLSTSKVKLYVNLEGCIKLNNLLIGYHLIMF